MAVAAAQLSSEAVVVLVGVECFLEQSVDGVGLAQLLQKGDQVEQLAVVHVVEPGRTRDLEFTKSKSSGCFMR